MEFSSSTRDSIMTRLNMYWAGSLGNGSNYTVDNGQRTIVMFDYGSGVTIPDYFYKDAFRFSIHEFAHYLLGGNEFHNGHGFWAMLSGYEVRSFMINAYERYRLGWCNLITVNTSTQTVSNATLTDFITTGVAYRIDITPSSNQFFFIENHQKISRWDNCLKTDYPDDRGLFVIRQDYSSSQSVPPMAADWMWLVPSEGRYNWEAARWEPNWWGSGYLPVFRKLAANRESGYSPTDMIPLYNPYIGQTQKYEVIFYEGANGQLVHDPLRYGKGKDAFRLSYNEVFSPWSNPNSKKANGNSTGIGFKINSFNSGVCVFDIYVNTALNAPPSKPQNLVLTKDNNNHPILTWAANQETDLSGYRVYKKLTISGGGSTTNYILTTSTTYTDMDFTITAPRFATDQVEYWIVAVDNTNKLSVGSDHVNTSGSSYIQWKLGENMFTSSVVDDYGLNQNYPNPFNPTTTIQYDVKEKGFVSLIVYDILGREVVSLVNESKDEGSYSVNFDASDLPSGIYIYTLRVNDFTASKKMTVLR